MKIDNSGRRSSFLGQDGFIWWVGVVVDRNDPLNCGRCRIRIKGIHSDNVQEVPNETLPWAQPLNPVNNSFQSPSTLKEGDFVMGFFMDGEQGQYPIVMGYLPIIPEEPENSTKQSNGFSDTRTEDDLKNAPQKVKKLTFNSDGSGVKIENTPATNYPNFYNEPTLSRLSRNESIDNTIVKSKSDNIVKNINTATNKKWSEPKTPYNSQYPYNHVIETESGHILEFDDTKGAERLHIYHRSGTFTEVHQNGDKVEKDVNNKYTIIMKDNMLYVMGNCNITVQNDANILVEKNCNLKVNDNINIDILKNVSWNVKGTVNWNVDGSVNWNFKNSFDMKIGSTGSINSSGNYSINAPKINLN